MVVLFALTMAYFEASVVVYLRAIAYPEGFSFPLSPIPTSITLTEVGREAASLLMILSVAVLAGKDRQARFGWFLIIFGIWDIFYYVFLYVLLGWPPSLLTWDVLFLIPVVWSGPVIAPVAVSLAMIVLGRLLVMNGVPVPKAAWYWLFGGALLIFFAFIWDYIRFLAAQPGMSGERYVPEAFPWGLFLIGLGFFGGVIRTLYIKKNI